MAIRPFLPLKVFAAGASFTPDPRGVVFHQSLDGGQSWQATSYAMDAGLGVRHLMLATGGVEETLYVATYNGVYRHTQSTVGASFRGMGPQNDAQRIQMEIDGLRRAMNNAPSAGMRQQMATRLADQDGHQVVGRKRSGGCRRRGIAAPRGKVALAHQKVRSGTVMTSPGDTV